VSGLFPKESDRRTRFDRIPLDLPAGSIETGRQIDSKNGCTRTVDRADNVRHRRCQGSVQSGAKQRINNKIRRGQSVKKLHGNSVSLNREGASAAQAWPKTLKGFACVSRQSSGILDEENADHMSFGFKASGGNKAIATIVPRTAQNQDVTARHAQFPGLARNGLPCPLHQHDAGHAPFDCQPVGLPHFFRGQKRSNRITNVVYGHNLHSCAPNNASSSNAIYLP